MVVETSGQLATITKSKTLLFSMLAASIGITLSLSPFLWGIKYVKPYFLKMTQNNSVKNDKVNSIDNIVNHFSKGIASVLRQSKTPFGIIPPKYISLKGDVKQLRELILLLAYFTKTRHFIILIRLSVDCVKQNKLTLIS